MGLTLKKLSQHPIAEMKDLESESILMRFLRKEIIQSVTFENGDKKDKMLSEANPQYKTVTLMMRI